MAPAQHPQTAFDGQPGSFQIISSGSWVRGQPMKNAIFFVAGIAIGAALAVAVLMPPSPPQASSPPEQWKRERRVLEAQLQFERQLRQVKSLTLTHEGFGDKVAISDPSELKALLDTFQVRAMDLGAVGLEPNYTMQLALRDGSTLETEFIDDTMIGLASKPGMLIYLKDRAFYNKVNAILSKRAGRSIDVIAAYGTR
jgi:hypothetical protein